MEHQTIQFGQYVVSTDLLNIIFPLIGTVIGGLISYFSIRAVENYKWKQHRLEKFQEKYREAIEFTLNWIDPFTNALDRAQSDVGDYFMGRKSEEEYLRTWPKILGHPAVKDPPKRLRILLPEYIYPRFMSILSSLERIESLPLRGIRGTEEFGNCYLKTQEHLSQLQEDLNKLEKDLINEYKKSIVDTPKKI